MWKLAAVVTAVAVLSGCASPGGSTVQPQVEYTFNTPQDTPREQWSEAMRVAHDLMGIPNVRDVVAPEPATAMGSAQSWTGADGVAVAGLGAVSPTTHVSSGGSAAIGAGLLLLGGGSSGPASTGQVVFWVPKDMASSAEEAAQVAARTWTDVRQGISGRKEKAEYVAPAQYPTNHSSNYATVKDAALDIPVPFSGSAQQYDLAGVEGEFYGPIYINRASIHIQTDKRFSKLDWPALMQRYADDLPAWAALYHPGVIRQEPPIVVFRGERHYFVAPGARQ